MLAGIISGQYWQLREAGCVSDFISWQVSWSGRGDECISMHAADFAAVVVSCKACKDCIALLGIALLGRDAAASSTSIGHPTISIEALSYSFMLLLIQMPPETLDIDRALKGLSEVLISILHSWDQSTDRAEATEYHVVQQCIMAVHQ